MVKLKTILDTRRAKADGTYSILFRITNHKEVKYIPFGLSVFETHWDSKTFSLNKHHPNASSINASISKKYYEIQRIIVNLEESEGYTFHLCFAYPWLSSQGTLATFKINEARRSPISYSR